MCAFCNLWMFWQLCECFGNKRTCTYLLCLELFVLCFMLFRLCIFMLICFVCTSVRTTATERKLNFRSNNNNNNNNNNTRKSVIRLGYTHLQNWHGIFRLSEVWSRNAWAFFARLCYNSMPTVKLFTYKNLQQLNMYLTQIVSQTPAIKPLYPPCQQAIYFLE
jgi:hypothetical protein